MQAKPAHIDILCTDSNGKQASKTSPAEAFPLPPFCYAFPVLLFLPFRIDRTRRGNNRIHKNAKQYKHKRRNERRKASNERKAERKSKPKGETDKHTHKQKSRSGYYIKIPSKQKPIKKQKQRKTSKTKRKAREIPEKHINRQAGEKRKAILQYRAII